MFYRVLILSFSSFIFYLMKTSYLYIKISLIFLFFFISISSLSALSFPSGYPTGQVQNGKIQGTLTNILSDC